MGYYTVHTLKIKNADTDLLNEILNFMRRNIDNYYGLDINKPSNFYDCSHDVKWYTHEEDMKILARKFPTATFILHGEGEDQGDIWEELYEGNISKSRRIIQVWSDWT